MKLITSYVLICLFALLVIAPNAHSYNSVMDTGKIISAGKYRVLAGPQFILSGDDGVNFSARVDAGVNDSSNIRALLGAGETDFYSGVFYKYIPYPDFENQPAIGFMGGATFARLESGRSTENATTISFAPIVSKYFEIDFGQITPSVSLPIGVKFFDGTTEVPIHLALGTEFKPSDFDFSFISEVGIELNKTFSYINLAIIFEFDENK